MKQCPVCQTTYPDEQRFCGQDGNPLGEFTPVDPLIGHVIAGTYQLRKKLGSAGELVYTVRGVGYSFRLPEHEPGVPLDPT